MKKWNLTATFLVCALCAIMMTGAGCTPQACYTDEVEPTAMESTAEMDSLDETADGQLDDAAAVQEEEPSQAATETATPESSEGETDSDPKPAEKAASQPAVKQHAQGSAAPVKQKTQPEAKTVSYEAESGDEEVPFVIDAVPAETEIENDAAKASTITINGVEISYVDSFGTPSAPESGAGLWKGSDSTTDGSFGYYIGHNYTEFGDVANLEQGSVVSVTDSNGDSCDYEVVDSFVVPEGSYWSDISDRVTGYGESVIMQTCVEDGYLIVVAE